MRKTRKRLRRSSGAPVVVGVAWYSPSQWTRLREVSADQAQLEQSYTEWVSTYEHRARELAASGLRMVRVLIDVTELGKSCRERNKAMNGAARSEYALEIVQRSQTTLDAVGNENIRIK